MTCRKELGLLFSVYYKIEHREEFLKKHFDKMFKNSIEEEKANTMDRLTDLMDLMVEMLLNGDKMGLYNLLTKKNTKSARVFFNYLTCSNIRSINKEVIRDRINEVFKI